MATHRQARLIGTIVGLGLLANAAGAATVTPQGAQGRTRTEVSLVQAALRGKLAAPLPELIAADSPAVNQLVLAQITTLVPGLEIWLSSPLQDDAAAWDQLQRSVNETPVDQGPTFSRTTLGQSPLFRERDHLVVSLWERVDRGYQLSSLALFGDRQGRYGQTGLHRSLLPGPTQRREAWRSALLARIEWSNSLEELAALSDEVLYYTMLSADESVRQAFDEQRFVWSGPDFDHCPSDYGPESGNPDEPRCTGCCDREGDVCDARCQQVGAAGAAVGCLAGVGGCSSTLVGAPAILACCIAGAKLGRDAAVHTCEVGCLRHKSDCHDDCAPRK